MNRPVEFGSVIGACLLGLAIGPAWAADVITTTDDLLKDPKFKAAYIGALGPKAKDRWLATMTNSTPVNTVSVAGERYQVAAPCKPHDCGDNNLLLLYSASRGVVYGHLYEKGKVTPLGDPPPALRAELQTMWAREFRQK